MTSLDVGTPPSGFRCWDVKRIRFHGFRDHLLPVSKGHYICSANFSCFGHQWRLRVDPCGYAGSSHGLFNIFLQYCSPGSIVIGYDFDIIQSASDNIIGSLGEHTAKFDKVNRSLGLDNIRGWSSLFNSLEMGTLVVDVRMKLIKQMYLPPKPFIPVNPSSTNILKMFNDQESADVIFEVQSGEIKGRKTRKSASKVPHEKFYAHRCILQSMSTKLAGLCGPKGDITTVSISNVKPEVFRVVLFYVYGGSPPAVDFTPLAKDVIAAAYEYDIVHLKIEAEARFVNSSVFSIDNVTEYLLYAHSKKCALLKEVAMDFIAANSADVIDSGLLDKRNIPKGLMSDLLVASSRGKRKSAGGDQFSMMRVTELRKRLAAKGLDFGGPREAMISTLRENA